MGDFTMPSLGADMETGTVARWLVKPGDEVHRGDIVAVVETEKSTIEVEIFESGVIDELLVPEGTSVPVGTAIARVRVPEQEEERERERERETVGAGRPVAGAPPAAPTVVAPPAVPVVPVPPLVRSPLVRHLAEEAGVDLATVAGSGVGGTVTRADVERAARSRRDARPGRTRSSPLARRLGGELGIDLSGVTGTGPGGSVVGRDVRLAAASASPGAPSEAPSPVVDTTDTRQAAMRRAIGGLMARSKREIPHYYLSTTVDVGAAMAWLAQANLDRPVTGRLVLPVLLVKATARAVARVPEMNGFFVDGAFTPSDAVHVGMAISLRTGGVIAPAIHDADRLPLDELMARLRDLVERARAGVLRSSEMNDPTITITNLGDLGVETVFGVIYPPQVALVGFGRVTDRPVAEGGMLGVRPCVTATLSADHRVSDGHRGGRFLAEIDRLLKEPENL